MRLFVIIGGLVVLVLLAALIAPPFINWNNFRLDFEREASRIAGRQVKVRGSTNARLLPLPAVTFNDIVVESANGGDPMMSADRFRMNIELAPLLKGDIVIVDMTMDRPRLNVEVDENGNFDWLSLKADLPRKVGADDVKVEKLTLTDGILRVRERQTEREIILRDIDAEMSARTLAGPWRGTGVFSHLDERFRLQGSTGIVRNDEDQSTLTTKLLLQPQNRPYDLQVNGPLSISKGGISLSGSFEIDNAQKQSAEDLIAFQRVAQEGNERISIKGNFSLSPEKVRVPDFQMEIGGRADPYTLTGSAEAAFGDGSRYTIVAEGPQIDIDRLAKAGAKGDGDDKALSVAERLAVVEEVLGRVPQPNMEGTVSLFLPAIVAGDTVVRAFGVDATPLPGRRGWRLNNLRAQLPGRTELRADGALALDNKGVRNPDAARPGVAASDGGMGFKGSLILASKQPSGFANWVSADVDDAILALPNAGFSANADISPAGATFKDMEIVLGEAQLKGSLSRVAAAEGERPVLAASLAGNRVDVDTLSALFGLFAGGEKTRPASLAAHDLDVALDVEEAVFSGVTARNVGAAFTYAGGNIEIDRLSIASLAGAEIAANGTVSGITSKPSGWLNGRLKMKNAEPFLALIGKRAGIPPPLAHLFERPELLADANLAFDMAAKRSGDLSDATLIFNGLAGGTQVNAKVEVSGAVSELGTSRVSTSLTAVNSDTLTLIRQLGLDPLPVDVPANARLDLQLEGIAEDGMDLDATLTADGSKLTFDGRYLSDPVTGPGVEGNIVARSDDIDPFLIAAGIPLPGTGTGSALSMRADFALFSKSLEATEMRGRFRDGPFSGNLSFDAAASPRPRLSGELRVRDFDLASVLESVSGSASLFDAGGLSARAFTGPAFRGYDAQVDLVSSNADLSLGLLPGAAPATKLRTTISVRDGDVRLSEMTANWLGGTVSGDIGFGVTDGTGYFSADIAAVDASAGDTGLGGDAPVLDGRFNIDTTLEGRGKSVDELVANLVGSGEVSVRGGAILGLNPKGFRPILDAADKQKDEDLETESAGIVRNAVIGGRFQFGSAKTPFAVSKGTIRISNMIAEADGLSTNTDLRIDLATGAIDGQVRGAYDPGRDNIEGVAPEFRLAIGGGLSRPTASVDATGMQTFLTSRLRERREREFEAQKSAALERQRLAQALRLAQLQEQARARARAEQERLEQERLEKEKLLREQQEADEAPAPGVASPASASGEGSLIPESPALDW